MLSPNRTRGTPSQGSLAITIQNAMSGRAITTCYVLPTDLIVHLKQCVKAVQDVPEITLMTQSCEFLNPVQTVQDVGLKNGDVVLAVLMAHRLVATASSDGRVKTWDTENNSVEREVTTAPPRSLLAACFSADGHSLVIGSAVGTPTIFDAKTGEVKVKFEQHAGSVSCVDISSQGRTVVSGGYDFLAKVWDVETGGCLKTLADPELAQEGGGQPRTHKLHLLAVKFSPYDSNLVATTSADCTIKLWSVSTGERLHKLLHDVDPYGPHPVTSVCFAANGQELVTTSDMFVTLWNVQHGQELRTWEAHTSQVTSAAHSVEEAVLLTGSKDGTAKIWDLQSGLCRRTLQGHEGPVSAVALSPDSKFAVTGSSDGQARIWNTQTGACEQTLQGNRLGVLMASFVPC
mmetsp:Transcript_64836/g.163337  ORF Transcript_64836/g.163337 Transcript_64836/m.163337 type:complete len:403 (-) Transcript_64836:36-1244(-)